MQRTVFWIVLSLLITIGVTAVLWILLGPYAFFGFLFLPFLFPFRAFGHRRKEAPTERACPHCGYTTMDPADRYCPRDGTPFA